MSHRRSPIHFSTINRTKISRGISCILTLGRVLYCLYSCIEAFSLVSFEKINQNEGKKLNRSRISSIGRWFEVREIRRRKPNTLGNDTSLTLRPVQGESLEITVSCSARDVPGGIQIGSEIHISPPYGARDNNRLFGLGLMSALLRRENLPQAIRFNDFR